MEGNSVLLIIVGIIIIFISYVISEKMLEKNTTGQEEISFDQSIFDKIWKEKETKFREDMDKIIQEKADETTNFVEDKLAHISNEKIMAVSEYSDQILENIDKNHKEVVFLYDMLNEKENEMKDFVQEIDKSKVVLEEIAHKELEKQKMIQHKQIQKELEKQKRKKEEKERQKDDLMMSGYISDKTIENTELEEEISTPIAKEEVKEEKSVLETMEGVVEEAPSEEKIKEPKQVELPIVEDNNNQVILDLYNEGKTIMEIAKLLGKGQGEVKLVIDLFQGITN